MERNKNIALLGVPIEDGAGRLGCSMGAQAMRCAKIMPELEALGCTVHDYGDMFMPEPVAVKAEGNLKHKEQITAWARSIYAKSYDVMQTGRVPIFMGGDHAMAMGTVPAMHRYAAEQNRPLKVLWLDAHADYNTPHSTPSGNMHGMPVSAFCGEEDLAFIYEGVDGFTPLSPSDVYMMGIRSVDAHEKEMIVSHGVNITDMRAIDEEGIFTCTRRIIKDVIDSDAMLHISFDVDFLDPAIAPGIGTRVEGGASYREAHLIMEMLYEANCVTSVDVVELNPMLDHEGRTANLMVDLMGSLFGKRIVRRPGSSFLK